MLMLIEKPACFEIINHQSTISRPRNKIPPNIKGRPEAGLSSTLESSYFLGAIASLAALATRNFTTVLALI